MPAQIPRVFISATSGDLGSVRQTIKEALLTINCQPVEQTNFEPDARSVAEVLAAKIGECQAIIHIAGFRYGAEPKRDTLSPEATRRSYTQLEYKIGRHFQEERGERRFRVYAFVCPEEFPYDEGATPESEELRSLQIQHREAILAGKHLRERPINHSEIAQRVLALQEQVRLMEVDQQNLAAEISTSRRLGLRSLLAIVVFVCFLGIGGWRLMKEQSDKTEATLVESNEVVEKATYALSDPVVLRAKLENLNSRSARL